MINAQGILSLVSLSSVLPLFIHAVSVTPSLSPSKTSFAFFHHCISPTHFDFSLQVHSIKNMQIIKAFSFCLICCLFLTACSVFWGCDFLVQLLFITVCFCSTGGVWAGGCFICCDFLFFSSSGYFLMMKILFFQDGCCEKIYCFICFSSGVGGQVVRDSLWVVAEPDRN